MADIKPPDNIDEETVTAHVMARRSEDASSNTKTSPFGEFRHNLSQRIDGYAD